MPPLKEPCIIANINSLKKLKKTSYTEIARRLNVSKTVLHRINSFHQYGTKEILDRLSKEYDLPIEFFRPSEEQIEIFNICRNKHLEYRKRTEALQSKLIRDGKRNKAFAIKEALNRNAFKRKEINGNVILKGLLGYLSNTKTSKGYSIITINSVTKIPLESLILYQELHECPVDHAYKIYKCLFASNNKLSPNDLLDFNLINNTAIEQSELKEIQSYALFLRNDSKCFSKTFPIYSEEYAWYRSLCASGYYGYFEMPETLKIKFHIHDYF